jgi:hypothetical protein
LQGEQTRELASRRSRITMAEDAAYNGKQVDSGIEQRCTVFGRDATNSDYGQSNALARRHNGIDLGSGRTGLC